MARRQAGRRTRRWLTELEGKVAIVTGGNTGIGKAVVAGAGGEGRQGGHRLRHQRAGHRGAGAEAVALGETAVGVEADVSKVEDLQRMVDTAVSSFGRLDVMVNNAGIETRTSVLDTTEEQYEKVLAINLKSAFFGTQLAAKQMIAQGDGGRIINMTSVHEDWPMPGNTPYCLSKGGMRMLTRTAGVELAPHNICVVGVGPGRGGHADQRADRGRSEGAGHAQQLPFRSVAWPSPRRSPRSWPSWPAPGRATSRPRRSSPTAASCRAARGSDRWPTNW